MIPFGAPKEAIDLEQRKLAKLNTIRLRSAQHAVAQRLGWSALGDANLVGTTTENGLDLRNARTLSSTMHPCPWLDLPEVPRRLYQ